MCTHTRPVCVEEFLGDELQQWFVSMNPQTLSLAARDKSEVPRVEADRGVTCLLDLKACHLLKELTGLSYSKKAKWNAPLPLIIRYVYLFTSTLWNTNSDDHKEDKSSQFEGIGDETRYAVLEQCTPGTQNSVWCRT